MLEDLNKKINDLSNIKTNLDLIASSLNSSVLSDDEYSVKYLSDDVKALSASLKEVIGQLNIQYVSLFNKTNSKEEK